MLSSAKCTALSVPTDIRHPRDVGSDALKHETTYYPFPWRNLLIEHSHRASSKVLAIHLGASHLRLGFSDTVKSQGSRQGLLLTFCTNLTKRPSKTGEKRILTRL